MPNLLDSFTLLDLFDILIVAVLIYYFTLFLKTEIATRILLFLLLFFALFYFSLFSGFTSTNWLLRNIFSSSLIILAIIFHGDLRRAIVAIGRRRDSGLERRDETAETVGELCKAVGEMAEKRIGALIVIVRHMSVDNIIEVGTEIDAKVTSELLNSIFLPYSPIHDGAVIITGRKITKAGCLLPLSRNPDIAKSFGTRHRAALGLSEMTDALIMVVSEETGKISMVQDGKIHYDIEDMEIRRTLRKALDVKRMSRNIMHGES